jgi:hypothetical protein
MSTPCEKHALLPVVGQSPCAGCERFEDAHEAAQKVVAAMSKDPLASKEKQND